MFQPVVEVGKSSTTRRLFKLGVTNLFNVETITARAMGMLTMSPDCFSFLNDSLIEIGSKCTIDLVLLQDYLDENEPLPEMVSFAGLAARLNNYTDSILIGWKAEDSE